MDRVLLIIDMQATFSASQVLRTIQSCQEEIMKAMLSQHHIIFLEWDLEGATDKRLTRLTDGYDRVHTCYKIEDSGAVPVMKRAHGIGLINPKFRVCGVNTDACVEKTVIGLAEYGRKGYNVEVVRSACGTEGGWSAESNSLRYMSKFPNVKVV